MTTTSVVRALGDLAHGSAHAGTAACACASPQVLADRPDGTVVRSGPVVAKAHAPDSETAALMARLSLAASPRLTGILLPPLAVRDAPEGPDSPVGSSGGRTVSLWPYGAPVDPSDPDAAPWEEAAVLLARLHRTPPPRPFPPMRGPVKAARAVARLRAARPGDPVVTPVLDAWYGLPGWARAETPTPGHRDGFLCHGDLHLGQLVRHPAERGPWLLIDVDDAGLGDPAWDLARPAAWYAAGLLSPEIWQRFLGTYRAAGGPAVRAEGDPWPELDIPARALTVQTAAVALAKSVAEDRSPDEVEQLLIDACVRIASLPPELRSERAP